MNHRSRWLGGLAAVAILLATATAAFGYAGQVAGTVTITVGAVSCTAPVVVTATVLETGTNAPIEGQPVNFGFQSSVTGDTISANTSTTNAAGQATTTVSLACTQGNRTVFGVADDARGSGVLGLTFTPAPSAAPAAGLPNTSTDGMEIPALLASALALASGAFLLRRYAFIAR